MPHSRFVQAVCKLVKSPRDLVRGCENFDQIGSIQSMIRQREMVVNRNARVGEGSVFSVKVKL